MARKARIVVPGAFHHVMARGIEGREIFADEEDRQKFLDLLKNGLETSGHRLYAWSLLPNHYHLLLKLSDAPLAEMMRRLNSTYARFFSAKHARRGYLFQDRYKSIVTQDQKYVEEIIRYIHLNPIRAGLCADLQELEEYRWCGHGVLMGRRSSVMQAAIGEILHRFGKSMAPARKAYCSFLKEGLSLKTYSNNVIDSIRKSNRDHEDILSPESWVIGDPDFVKKVFHKVADRKIRLARYQAEALTLETVARRISETTGVPVERMRHRSRGGAVSDARKIFAFISRRIYGFPVQEVGRFLGISGPPVSISIPAGEKLVKERKININI